MQVLKFYASKAAELEAAVTSVEATARDALASPLLFMAPRLPSRKSPSRGGKTCVVLRCALQYGSRPHAHARARRVPAYIRVTPCHAGHTVDGGFCKHRLLPTKNKMHSAVRRAQLSAQPPHRRPHCSGPRPGADTPAVAARGCRTGVFRPLSMRSPPHDSGSSSSCCLRQQPASRTARSSTVPLGNCHINFSIFVQRAGALAAAHGGGNAEPSILCPSCQAGPRISSLPAATSHRAACSPADPAKPSSHAHCHTTSPAIPHLLAHLLAPRAHYCESPQ